MPRTADSGAGDKDRSHGEEGHDGAKVDEHRARWRQTKVMSWTEVVYGIEAECGSTTVFTGLYHDCARVHFPV